jgi:Holliday junction resolvase-like predicted endonuclease
MQPEQSINKAKQRNLVFAADGYIRRYRLTKEVQIDVISIVFNGMEHVLEYIPNAVYPTA